MKQLFIDFVKESQRDGSDVLFVPLFIATVIGTLALVGWFIYEMTRLIMGC
jgi:hypothetical protein